MYTHNLLQSISRPLACLPKACVKSCHNPPVLGVFSFLAASFVTYQWQKYPDNCIRALLLGYISYFSFKKSSSVYSNSLSTLFGTFLMLEDGHLNYRRHRHPKGHAFSLLCLSTFAIGVTQGIIHSDIWKNSKQSHRSFFLPIGISAFLGVVVTFLCRFQESGPRKIGP